MPAPVVGALIHRLTTGLGVAAWDGETPRNDQGGTPIVPGTGTSTWPAVNVEMPGRMRVDYTFGDCQIEEGAFTVRLWGTTRGELEGTLDSAGNVATPGLVQLVFALLAKDWNLLVLGSPSLTVSILVDDWGCKQSKDKRTQLGTLLYEADLGVTVTVRGLVATDGDSPHP